MIPQNSSHEGVFRWERVTEESMGQLESGGIDNRADDITVDPKAQRHEAAALVHLFVRAFNAAMSSDDDDDSALTHVREELQGNLEEVLKKAGSVPLEIGPFEVLWEGELVYEDHDPEGFPNILYQGGIREFLLSPGISDREFTAFFNAVRASRDGKEGGQELAVGLRQRDLPHVQCVVADEYLEIHPLPLPENLEKYRRQYARQVTPGVWQSKIFREYCADSEIEFLEPLNRDHSSGANRFRVLNPLYLATPEEIEIINRQIQRESTTAFRLDALETVIEVLLMEKSKDDFDQVFSFIVDMLDHCLKTGDYQGAAEVLGKLYPCLHLTSLSEWQKRRIRKAIFDAGAESRIAVIAERINFSGVQDLDGLSSYVSLLQRNAVPHLCRLLGELRGSKTRRILCDGLVNLGRNSIGVFGAFLDDDRWYVVSNIVHILGRIGKAECLPYLERALDHPDTRVRREGVQAISMAASKETAIQHLMRKLNDIDGKIRGIAALRLARIGREDALGPLLDLVLSKPFQKREIREITSFLQAIGVTGSDGAVPALSQILLKRSFLSKAKADGARRSAANALGAIGTNKAIMALRQISKTGDELAREASLAALERIGK